ncbi:MAG: YceI family protein [Candidatus Dormibacteria bacterium]
MSARRGMGLAAVVMALLLATAAFLLLHWSRRAAAPPLTLSASPSSGPGGATDLAGTWVVDEGSQAGYRVKERFTGQPSDTEAVARSGAVSGKMVLGAGNSKLQLQAASFSADLRQLHSEDANAAYGNLVRDEFVGRIYLETAVYPQATFQARLGPLSAATLPADISLRGTFTVHGVTRDLTIVLKVARNGPRLEVVGSFPLHYGDYGIEVPNVPFTSAAPDATIEVHLFLRRQG